MGFTNCLINGHIHETFVLYDEDGAYVGYEGRYIKATWNAERGMWSIKVLVYQPLEG